MDANNIITLVDREFEISKRYNEHTDESEYITNISLTDLTGWIWTDEGATDLRYDMYRIVYNSMIDECEEQARAGDKLHSRHTLIVNLDGGFIHEGGSIFASAWYDEEEDTGGMDLYFYDDLIERRPEEDDTGNKIADNVLYNEILDALKGLDDYQGVEAEPFDRLKEEAAKNRKENK